MLSFFQSYFLTARYDKSETGKLEKDELKAYLTELNDGKEPSDEEVGARARGRCGG